MGRCPELQVSLQSAPLLANLPFSLQVSIIKVHSNSKRVLDPETPRRHDNTNRRQDVEPWHAENYHGDIGGVQQEDGRGSIPRNAPQCPLAPVLSG